MAEAKVINCTCKSEFQDEKYGKGHRLGNPMSKGGGSVSAYRCTVCGKETSK